MTYGSRSYMEGQFGVKNIAVWADLDNDKSATKVAARVLTALAWADAEVNRYMRGGPYAVPLVTSDPVIVEAASVLAAVWLYENRGVQDYNPDTGEGGHRLMYRKRGAYSTLQNARFGSIRIDAPMIDGIVPVVVKEERTLSPYDPFDVRGAGCEQL